MLALLLLCCILARGRKAGATFCKEKQNETSQQINQPSLSPRKAHEHYHVQLHRIKVPEQEMVHCQSMSQALIMTRDAKSVELKSEILSLLRLPREFFFLIFKPCRVDPTHAMQRGSE